LGRPTIATIGFMPSPDPDKPELKKKTLRKRRKGRKIG
jgi:hypothetical protein